MKKNLLFCAACALIVALGSCTNDVLDEVLDDSQPTEEPTRSTNDTRWLHAYVLCEGTWKAGNASIPGYLIKYDSLWNEISRTQVGDTGNALIKYGSKLYCAVSGNGLTADNGGIRVFNAGTGTALTSLIQYDDPKSGHKIMPRHLAAHGGKVYISLYSGAVMSIDTLVYAKQNSLALAATYSEGICVANDQVYVCNSGNANDTSAGSGNTISVLPLDLSEEDQLTIVSNPKLIKQAPDGTIYFNALGNYTTESSALYKLTTTGYSQITDQVGGFGIGADAVYTADIDWMSMDYDTHLKKVTFTGVVSQFNVSTLPDFMFGYSVSVNPYNGDVCIGQSMGQDLNIFKSDGTGPTHTIETGVANVNSVVFAN